MYHISLRSSFSLLKLSLRTWPRLSQVEAVTTVEVCLKKSSLALVAALLRENIVSTTAVIGVDLSIEAVSQWNHFHCRIQLNSKNHTTRPVVERMDLLEVQTPKKQKDIFDELLPAASESPIDEGALDPPATGTGSTRSVAGAATPGQGPSKTAGRVACARDSNSSAAGCAGAATSYGEEPTRRPDGSRECEYI